MMAAHDGKQRTQVLVLSGTGSCCFGRAADGRTAKIGGWGHILGDGGSAYWIALESVKAAIAAEEGLGPKTRLSRAIRRWFNVKKLTEIVPAIYRPDFAKEELAALAERVAKEVSGRDAVFYDICCRAGRDLASQALAAARLARLKARPLPVYLVGGVLAHNTLVRASLVAALKKSWPVRIEELR